MFDKLGLILSLRKSGESDAVIEILSQSGEIISGFVKYATSGKNIQIYQISNLVQYSKIGREGTLGTVKASCEKSYSSVFIGSKIAIFCATSICYLAGYLMKTDVDGVFFTEICDFFQFCKNDIKNEKAIVEKYLKIEKLIISKTGEFNLESDKNLDLENNNYKMLQNIFLGYKNKMPNCRSLLQKELGRILA